MPIEFRCSQCNKLLRTGDATAGKQAKCPECGSVMTIPAPEIPPSPPPQPSGGAGATDPFAAPRSPSPGLGPIPVPAAPETMNPYQSPASQAQQPATFAAPGQIIPTRIDSSETLGRTWSVFGDRWSTVFGGVFLVFMISMAANYAQQFAGAIIVQSVGDPAVAITVVIMGQIIYQVFATWLGIGMQMFLLQIVRGGEANFGLLFSGGRFLLPIILCALLTGLIVMCGFVLLIIPGIIFALMLSQAQLLIIDRNLGVIDALSTSRDVTAGNKMTLFGIWLVCGLLGCLLILLTCGLGLLAVIPYFAILNIVIYLSVTGQPTMADRYGMPTAEPGATPFGQPAPGTPPMDTPPSDSPFDS